MRTEAHQEKGIGGLKISFVNTCMIVVTAILAIFLFMISGHVRASYDSAIHGASEYIYLEQQANIVHEASDYLTTEVRLFVETTDLTHAELYFKEANVTKRREAALDALAQQDPALVNDINEAVAKSKELMKREIYAMQLVCSARGYDHAEIPPEVRAVSLEAADEILSPAEKLEKAQLMVFDDTYQQAKAEIYSALELFTDGIINKTKQEFDFRTLELSNLLSLQRVLICVLIVMVALISFAIVFLITKPLRVYLNNIQKQQLLEPVGAFEFRYMAQIYNENVVEKQAFRHKAEHDLMTGVLNRASAEARVRELMASPASRGILILFDINDLKDINDSLGHKAGDKAILSLAKALKSQFRDGDVIGRLGGDEFLLYLPDAAENQESISLSLASMQQKLSTVLLDEASKRRVYCSIGCAVQTSDTVTYEDLFKQADLALYHVKRSVKNSFAFFGPEMLKNDYQFKLKQAHPVIVETSDDQALSGLLEVVSTKYPGIVLFNLTQNYFRIMNAGKNVTDVHAPDKVDAFWTNRKENIHPEDWKSTFATLSREGLLKASGAGIHGMQHFYRNMEDTGYISTEVAVRFYTNPEEDICAFLFFRRSAN